MITYPSSCKESSDKYPLTAAIVLSVAFLCATHHLPSQVNYDPAAGTQIAALHRSLVHEISCLIIGCIGAYWLYRSSHSVTISKPRIFISLGALVLWSAFSISWAQEPLVSARRIIALVLVMIGAAGTAAYWPRRAIAAFISASSGFYLTLGVIGQIAIGNFMPLNSNYRFAGTLPWNEEGFACLILIMSSLTAMDMNPRYKGIFRILLCYGIIFLVLTRSRSSLVGAVAGILIYVVLTRPLRFHLKAGFSVMASVILLFTAGILDPIFGFLSRNGQGMESLTDRVPLWHNCWPFIAARPLLGYGYDDFWTASHIDYFSGELHWGVSASHSGYIEALLTLGAIGLVLHVSVLVIGGMQGASCYRMSGNYLYALAACLCAVYLLVGAVESVMVVELSPYSFYLFVLFFAFSDTRYEKSHTSTPRTAGCLRTQAG